MRRPPAARRARTPRPRGLTLPSSAPARAQFKWVRGPHKGLPISEAVAVGAAPLAADTPPERLHLGAPVHYLK